MKTLIAISLVLARATSVDAQDIPGLSYCLLFDSNLEKNAFKDTNRNNCDPMIFLLAYDPKIDSVTYDRIQQSISAFVQKLESRKDKTRNELSFLKYVFQKTHNKYLKSYNKTESFGGIFNDGSYNCVSGTALYACILTQLGYAPEIIETRYHIFLKVTTSDSVHCLFEATDPFGGFEYRKEVIDSRINRYLADEAVTVGRNESITAPFNTKTLSQSVSLVELAGLHYYNIAVDFVNQGNYYEAFRALKKASLLYPGSERIAAFLHFTQLRYDDELSKAFAGN